MTQFELFCLIYYALDAVWDETKEQELGEYLSSANPFLWEDLSSAEPTVYAQFCEMIPDSITLDQSYQLASKYINSLKSDAICSAFKKIRRKSWNDAASEYLSRPHKA